MQFIETDHAPRPAGHYSQAIVHGDLVFVSGQLPIRTDGSHETGDIDAQMTRTLANLSAILAAAGCTLADVIRTTVYVADIALWPRVNAVYAATFGPHRPARTVVPVPTLHYGLLVEIDAIAARPASR